MNAVGTEAQESTGATAVTRHVETRAANASKVSVAVQDARDAAWYAVKDAVLDAAADELAAQFAAQEADAQDLIASAMADVVRCEDQLDACAVDDNEDGEAGPARKSS